LLYQPKVIASAKAVRNKKNIFQAAKLTGEKETKSIIKEKEKITGDTPEDYKSITEKGKLESQKKHGKPVPKKLEGSDANKTEETKPVPKKKKGNDANMTISAKPVLRKKGRKQDRR